MTSAQLGVLSPPGPREAPPPKSRPGFRLARFEVYNWGTFDGRVWPVTLGGENALVTGEIGSGKSTLVDGVATLLVPPQKLAYNKAAGADPRERSAKSYVLGYHRSERGESGMSARPVALRDPSSYSVLLAQFYDEALQQHVTLAQVFWLKEAAGQPARLYVVANEALTIADHFAGFGEDISSLRKRLRADGAELHESFARYGGAFCRRFGIDSESALHLFHQTVSMKSVGNLTEFVRQHMLEPFTVDERIGALLRHFDDLHRAHEAVLKAKAQVEVLTPLVAECDRYEQLSQEIAGLRSCRDALAAFFATLKLTLLEVRCEQLDGEVERYQAKTESLQREKETQDAKRDELKAAIARNGGDRIEQIERRVRELGKETDRRRHAAERYEGLCTAVGLPPARDAVAFAANRRGIGAARSDAEQQRDDVQNELVERAADARELQQQHVATREELDSLRRRRSNVPANVLRLRASLCAALDLDEEALPFAGELLQVRAEERDWEGAIERLLYSFALSLLVSEEHYARVAKWVDTTHLGQRLVYFRVREEGVRGPAAVGPASVVRRLEAKPDAALLPWLECELARRFDFHCCDSMDELRRATRGLTRAGQVKGANDRHDKDDRHRIDDRSRYVLGWSNQEKIALLEKEQRDLEQRLALGEAQLEKLRRKLTGLQERLEHLAQLNAMESFGELDWHPLVLEQRGLEQERADLESASDVLRQLQEELGSLEEARRATGESLDGAKDSVNTARTKKQMALEQRAECDQVLAEAAGTVTEEVCTRLAGMKSDALGDKPLTVETCPMREKDMRAWLQDKIDAADKREKTLRGSIQTRMHTYRTRWAVEAQEVDASVEAAPEYRAMLLSLCTDDLPRFEAQFKELLNVNTIREVAAFQTQLRREQQLILERIEVINRSLREIDYNEGRYIALEAAPNHDLEVREFQSDLRACTENALTGSEDDAYSEAKFLQVTRIIERFRGREGLTEADRRWTQKVTDVRQWFTFTASERWREDGSEHEHYTDSGGKSGGQKEKLAYTVLAASLAYQFGLEREGPRTRSFRFVMIDEAFGRADDDAAQFGLELFQRLGLQLLVITPMQKIHVIEPYVCSVGFVHNDGGSSSKVRNLTIEEYRAEREARRA